MKLQRSAEWEKNPAGSVSVMAADSKLPVYYLYYKDCV